ncbi:hypothetical protein [Rhodoplanes azumiensis]|uniref:Uncharacterized protein n=1 Tax=Rhodoplanes azumiensis TaxID=1897628 RepID=A0ABW5AHR3_9BRAD
MRLFMFESETTSDLRAFAGDSSGSKLPERLGPWHSTGVVRPDRDPPHKLSRAAIEKAIAAAGYQLFRMKPTEAASAAKSASGAPATGKAPASKAPMSKAPMSKAPGTKTATSAVATKTAPAKAAAGRKPVTVKA